ncbi:MAG: ABC transporter ATP-binding protein [Cyanobacteria bacterium P01_A01_bin.116]
MISALTHLSDQADASRADIAIAIQDLTFQYPDCEPVLNQLSLSLQVGQRVGVIGHNGCGKTTLFMLLCGVLAPNSGTISLLNKPIEPRQFRPEIGMLFQDPDDQLFSPTVREDIAFGPENMGFPAEVVSQRVDEALSATGTAFLAERTPHHLSGGEKQMVAIASLLAMQPEVVLYDEPTASLDMRTRRRLISFLQRSTQTILVSSHDLEFILDVCDRVLLIDNGQIIADGDPMTIMGNQPLMEAHGLEKPHSLIPHVRSHHRLSIPIVEQQPVKTQATRTPVNNTSHVTSDSESKRHVS